MPIIRGKHSFEGHFTQIPNAWVRDKRLSYKARGLLAELMSHEPGFRISRESIARSGQDGDRAVRSAIAELEAAGYLRRSQERADGQRFGAAVWTTTDPFPPSVRFAPAGNAPADNGTQKKTKEEKTKEKELKTLVQDELGRKFDDFWKIFPRHEAKANARDAFLKAARTTSPDTIIAGAVAYANDPNRVKQYTRLPATWLNGSCWDDDPLPARETTPEEKAEKLRIERAKKAEVDRENAKRVLEEQKAAAEQAKANPAKRCEHDRVAVICSVCSKPPNAT
ncbi:hypothetical protein UFOVP609_35 [uncultured Caudovirales phage]|uniref:Helix-turn-helix domain containing protein n=1 Tax=uncultured Caudovirales phage TaxID=2100421 RepID=A0A6J5N724_9CAUD|nr:hypothetical protein UFOVP609_35 [uncultured Caudovirales phage]